jgi:N-dimethylarginine dimethylaminohydrolase
MPRTVLMVDPTYFSVLGGANPHTRNALGIRKSVNADRAREQWPLARALIAHGTEVCVVEPHQGMSGPVYPANAGFLYPLDGVPGTKVLSRPPAPGASASAKCTVRSLDDGPSMRRRGGAPFSRRGFHAFTHGRVERQRFVPRIEFRRGGAWLPAGFSAAEELARAVNHRPIHSLELYLEAHYHGDTVLCSFGPRREYLLAYMEGLTAPSRERLRLEFSGNLIELAESDAALYAANSFQVDYEGRLFLFMPEGVSDALIAKVRERRVEPVLVDVSEFLAKGGGSVKCMILDLGPRNEQPADSAATRFRAARSYETLFPSPMPR